MNISMDTRVHYVTQGAVYDRLALQFKKGRKLLSDKLKLERKYRRPKKATNTIPKPRQRRTAIDIYNEVKARLLS